MTKVIERKSKKPAFNTGYLNCFFSQLFYPFIGLACNALQILLLHAVEMTFGTAAKADFGAWTAA
jgi:hypothetical protein